MASLYYYEGQNYPTVTAKGSSRDYTTMHEFRAAVHKWLRDNDINTVYNGEQTIRMGRDDATFEYRFTCIKEEHAMLAALRWA
jgi:hypothetical protein